MTPEEWKYVEDRLVPPFGEIKLLCDDYEVTLQVQRIEKMKYGIIVYINGKLNWGWLREDCEERRRFMRPISRPLFTPSQQKAEKQLAKLLKRPSRHDVKHVYWVPDWSSVTAMRRHFCRNNQVIELVRDGQSQEAV